MVVNDSVYSKAYGELNDKIESISNKISLNETSRNPIELKISIAGVSKLTADEALKLAKDLETISNLVKNFTYNGYLIKYDI
ncbi:hypothetical protein KQI68_06450 [Peptoniphilus sp. MSJ-1]|uniref:Uncharacterized protein n=1 Tax=Peptoniphilus ovalis TaxID=2841503 RepID=A0ABS6FH25_9FIRM|nr:hypothetical protein [Peptoniphilus ovalis]MBU5669477.1 hypothetical protein [Peptoniphilus ovalis]